MISKYACRRSLCVCACVGGTTTKELIKGAVGVGEI